MYQECKTKNYYSEQQNSFRGIAETDTDSVEKFIIFNGHEINANPEKHISTKIPKKKPLQSGKKVIILGDSMLRHKKPDILSEVLAQ